MAARRGAMAAWPRRMHLHALELIARSGRGARWLTPQYHFAFDPEQLWLLCDQLDSVADVDGSVLEVGCAQGATTIYLNKHLDQRGRPRPYFCVDTFSGFTARDIEHERTRGHDDDYEDFDFNSPQLFTAAMRLAGLRDRVTVTQADIVEHDLAAAAPVAFALVDVDLYVPMLAGLRKVWPILAPGGVIVVDDCLPNSKWDGALEAYVEVCEELGQPVDIRAGKLGLLRRPLATA